jgi:putative membrane protein
MMIIVAVAIVFGIVFLLRRSRRSWRDCCGTEVPGDHRNETPIEILKRRYAAGEINREEFERMKKDIE